MKAPTTPEGRGYRISRYGTGSRNPIWSVVFTISKHPALVSALTLSPLRSADDRNLQGYAWDYILNHDEDWGEVQLIQGIPKDEKWIGIVKKLLRQGLKP